MRARRVIQLLVEYLDHIAVIWLWALLAYNLLKWPIFEHESNVVGSAALVIACMGLTWIYSYTFEGRFTSSNFRGNRMFWTLGLLTLFLHVAIAFEIRHDWSHEAAVEHVRRVGGFGWGILVNYLFALVWLADVVWWWGSPASHASRSRWIGRSIHGFLFFVVVNSTVVFGADDRRWGFAFAFVFFPLMAIVMRYGLQRLELHYRPGSPEVKSEPRVHSPT